MNPEHEYHNEACGCMPTPEAVTFTTKEALDALAQAEMEEGLYDRVPKENNNGTDIQPPDNVSSAAVDNGGIPTFSAGEVNGLTDADLGASKPIPEPKPTLAQVKAWRNTNFTVKHSTVNACGHKIDLRHFPSNANCEDCWEAFFSVSPEGVASVHDLLLKDGTKAVIAMHGAKFTKWFGKFLQKKLLSQYRATEGYASGIEGSVMDIKEEVDGIPDLHSQ